MKQLLFAFCLALPMIVSAKQKEISPSFPILGYIKDSSLRIPPYKSKQAAIPKKLYAYLHGKEMIATLNAGKPSSGAFIYDFPNKTEVPDADRVLVFDRQHTLKETAKDVYSDKNSDFSWAIVELGSSEGYHLILQTLKKGQCIRHIDYYFHVDYDTEPDSDEKFKEAFCGETVEP